MFSKLQGIFVISNNERKFCFGCKKYLFSVVRIKLKGYNNISWFISNINNKYRCNSNNRINEGLGVYWWSDCWI